MKNKNTLLHDFMKIYRNIECEALITPCSKCKNKKLCKAVEYVIDSIEYLYND